MCSPSAFAERVCGGGLPGVTGTTVTCVHRRGKGKGQQGPHERLGVNVVSEDQEKYSGMGSAKSKQMELHEK